MPLKTNNKAVKLIDKDVVAIRKTQNIPAHKDTIYSRENHGFSSPHVRTNKLRQHVK